MKCAIRALLLSSGFGSTHAAAVTPTQKVVELLDGLVARAESEMHAEKVQYAGFKQFCDDVAPQKQKDIDAANSQLELLNAEILKHDSEVSRLQTEIEGHAAQYLVFEGNAKDADNQREAERSTFLTGRQNYTESVEALQYAIQVLKSQAKDTVGSYGTVSLLSKKAALPLEAKRKIEAFLARSTEDPDADLTFSPPVNAYSFQSDEIIDMMEKLHEKFKDELTQMEKDEADRRHTYQMLTQEFKDSMDAEKESQASKTESQQKHKQLAHEKRTEANDVIVSRDADVKYLDELKTVCAQKATEYDSRMKLRQEEIDTLEKATEIIKSSKVSGSADKHLPASFLQAGSSFVQLGSEQTDPNLERAVTYLSQESVTLDSHVLSELAMQARGDPFEKVKRLIEALITRLMHEATEEAEHKGWCDTELATNEHTRKTKTEEVETLTNELEQLDVRIAQLTKDLVAVNAEIVELDHEAGNATSLRQTEKAENEATIQDAKDGQVAVAEAVKLLKDFYANASAATAFVQKRSEPLPEIWDKPYRGMQSSTGGVVGMMEVIHSDFARLESDATSSEAEAAEAYRKFMEDYKIAKTQKETDVKHMDKEKSDKEGLVIDKKAELDTAQQLLDTAKKEFESLKPACLGGGQTYDERKGRREDEIAALKNALEILEGATPA